MDSLNQLKKLQNNKTTLQSWNGTSTCHGWEIRILLQCAETFGKKLTRAGPRRRWRYCRGSLSLYDGIDVIHQQYYSSGQTTSTPFMFLLSVFFCRISGSSPSSFDPLTLEGFSPLSKWLVSAGCPPLFAGSKLLVTGLPPSLGGSALDSFPYHLK